MKCINPAKRNERKNTDVIFTPVDMCPCCVCTGHDCIEANNEIAKRNKIQFEYLVDDSQYSNYINDLQKRLDEKGQDGWELVNYDDAGLMIFKRRKV